MVNFEALAHVLDLGGQFSVLCGERFRFGSVSLPVSQQLLCLLEQHSILHREVRGIRLLLLVGGLARCVASAFDHQLSFNSCALLLSLHHAAVEGRLTSTHHRLRLLHAAQLLLHLAHHESANHFGHFVARRVLLEARILDGDEIRRGGKLLDRPLEHGHLFDEVGFVIIRFLARVRLGFQVHAHQAQLCRGVLRFFYLGGAHLLDLLLVRAQVFVLLEQPRSLHLLIVELNSQSSTLGRGS
mmetsp:Transcript_25017/g.50271  ORF Transcript_25017/g.50271 Transcript_25017/m.50271 type:complete len:242 (+) Transcript_25017:431-1156(+)